MDRGAYSLGLNQQLFDMGVPQQMLFEVDAAYSVALKIMKKFDLVMIAEHFDESMILMADLLCWPLKYVASFKNNVLPSNKKVLEIVKGIRSFALNNKSILK